MGGSSIMKDSLRLEPKVEPGIDWLASARALAGSLDAGRVAEQGAIGCVRQLGASMAWVGRARPDGGIEVAGAFGDLPPGDGATGRWDDSPAGEVPGGRAIRSRSPVVEPDLKACVDLAPWRREALGAGYRSLAAVPLVSGGCAIGAITACAVEPRFFTDARVAALGTWAELVAGALENARRFQDSERRLQRLRALRTIDIAIAGSLDVRAMLAVVLDQVSSQLGVDAVDVLSLSDDGRALSFAAGCGFRTQALQHTHLRMGEGFAGRAAARRTVVAVADLRTEAGGFRKSPLFEGEGFVTFWAVPLIARGVVKGVLEAFHRSRLQPDPEWLDFLEALAGQAAIALDNAGLFEALQRQNVELALAYETTLEGWSRAIDMRDHETEGHNQRVARITLDLARLAGLPDTDLIHVRRGALLHDIGKIGVPDAVLLKPGPLTDDEWKVMRQHPTLAMKLLAPIPYLRASMDIPYCHHERWDGKGYPTGLSGAQIPLTARLFAIADVWDALTSARPYRGALAADEALDIIRGGRGTQFDPDLTDLFLDHPEVIA